METLAKSWSKSIHICFGNTKLVTISRKNNNFLEYWQEVVKFIANIAEKDNRDANHLQRSWWHQSSTLASDYALPDKNIGKWTTGPHWDVVALVKTVLCQKGGTLPLTRKCYGILIGLAHVRHIIPRELLPQLVDALVVSHVRYCLAVYGNGTQKNATPWQSFKFCPSYHIRETKIRPHLKHTQS